MKKGCERIYAQISLDNLKYNLDSVRRHLKPETKICAVVKADAYGHGAIETAKAICEDVWGFAVATPDEALELREGGLANPVLILGYVPVSRFGEMIENGFRVTLFEKDKIEAFSEAAVRLGKTGYYHIKVDTGMSRIGLVPDDGSIRLIESVHTLPGIEAEGIFTHLATADMKDNSSALCQAEVFKAFTEKLHRDGVSFTLIHAANSAASILNQGFGLDMCRLGVVLYGICPSEDYDWMTTPLKPVLSLYSEVIYVKTVPAGTPVSYGETFVTARETRIATVSTGYADGYPRSLSNCGHVLIRGEKAPIIGRICMDQMMVDITDLHCRDEVREEDRVTLIGTDGDAHIAIEELSELSGRFPYEFVCDISKRVPRVYD